MTIYMLLCAPIYCLNSLLLPWTVPITHFFKKNDREVLLMARFRKRRMMLMCLLFHRIVLKVLLFVVINRSYFVLIVSVRAMIMRVVLYFTGIRTGGLKSMAGRVILLHLLVLTQGRNHPLLPLLLLLIAASRLLPLPPLRLLPVLMPWALLHRLLLTPLNLRTVGMVYLPCPIFSPNMFKFCLT